MLSIRSFGVGDGSRQIEAVIDTGFTDALTLPPDTIEALGLSLRGSTEVMLANGDIEQVGIHRVELVWHGRRQLVTAYGVSGGALVGMGLLRGSRLTVEAVPGGGVMIEELSRSSS